MLIYLQGTHLFSNPLPPLHIFLFIYFLICQAPLRVFLKDKSAELTQAPVSAKPFVTRFI
nr:MAG TPA: hypothetical protein [Caudoviricetes sp.]